MLKTYPLLVSVIVSVVLAGVLFLSLNLVSLKIFPCTESSAQNLVLALCLLLILHLLVLPKIRFLKYFPVADIVLILLIFWLGRYPNFSPLRGFMVTTTARARFVKNREIVSLRQGAVTALSPLTTVGGSKCIWSSTNGGLLDDPNSCEVIYVPPNADHDILKMRVRSVCGLPDAIGEIKISILP